MILEHIKTTLDDWLDKRLVLDVSVLIIVYKCLLLGITVQETTSDGEKPESRIRSHACFSMYL